MLCCARFLGVMLDRGEVFGNIHGLKDASVIRRLIGHDNSIATLDAHLPYPIVTNNVTTATNQTANTLLTDAIRVGYNAVSTLPAMLIYRAPLHDIYQTRTRRTCDKKKRKMMMLTAVAKEKDSGVAND
uniref:Uncharacterized protein n=1 Tax=Lygus hesperus TaxID=30085 RepID=A0A146MCV7_LYGHE